VAASSQIYLVAFGPFALGKHVDPSSAYASSFGRPFVDSLVTYVGWAVSVLLPIVPRAVDAVDPSLLPVGVLGIMLWGAGNLLPSLRRRGWWAGGLLFAALLLPVLPLANHTYRYYLYAPLLGFALCVGAFSAEIVEIVQRRVARKVGGDSRSSRASRPVLAIKVAMLAIAAVVVLRSAERVQQIAHRPLHGLAELRGDPIVDRSRIARNAIGRLQAAQLPQGVHLRFLSLDRMLRLAEIQQGRPGAEPLPEKEAYLERNLRAALLDGLGVRALVRQVDSVEFIVRLESAGENVRYAVYTPDGFLHVFDRPTLDSLLHLPLPGR
jgi:hypothetical protein